MKKCSTIQQGYPSIQTMKNCQLSHTGFELWPFLVIALLMVGAGVIFRVGGSVRRSKRPEGES